MCGAGPILAGRAGSKGPAGRLACPAEVPDPGLWRLTTWSSTSERWGPEVQGHGQRGTQGLGRTCQHLLSVSGEPLLSDGGGHTHNCSLYHLCPKCLIRIFDCRIRRWNEAFPSALSSALRVTQVLEKALMMACLSKADCDLTGAWWSKRAWLCSHSSYLLDVGEPPRRKRRADSDPWASISP